MVEVLSPDDETYAKFGFYAEHGVDEVVVVDPSRRRIEWYALDPGGYAATPHSAVLDLAVAAVEAAMTW